MNCIVTAGPTYESLDQVRRLTNFSTGKLGVELANSLTAQGHRVVLLKGYYAVYPGTPHAGEVTEFSTTADLRARLQGLAPGRVDAVFHAAAVSDFGFGRVFSRDASGDMEEVQAGKFSTRQGSLLVELIPTPKILPQLRSWFPGAWLVGWKYEVDGTKEDAVAAGTEQIRNSSTNACVVNGPAYGPGFGLLADGKPCVHLPEVASLFDHLSRNLAARSASHDVR
jgi:phosphopantothenoylcysteine decarboxylase/phosphopantothenate--cysteine ligase